MGIIRLQSSGSACTNLSSDWRTHLNFTWPSYNTSLALILLHLSYLYHRRRVGICMCECRCVRKRVPVLIMSTVFSNYCLVTNSCCSWWSNIFKRHYVWINTANASIQRPIHFLRILCWQVPVDRSTLLISGWWPVILWAEISTFSSSLSPIANQLLKLISASLLGWRNWLCPLITTPYMDTQ